MEIPPKIPLPPFKFSSARIYLVLFWIPITLCPSLSILSYDFIYLLQYWLLSGLTVAYSSRTEKMHACVYISMSFPLRSTSHALILCSIRNWYLSHLQNEVSVKIKLKWESTNKISIFQRDGTDFQWSNVFTSHKIATISNSSIQTYKAISH